jgi:hypothetical protein
LRVSASVGVAKYPDDGGDADVLVRVAAAALEAAKWGGAGRVYVGPVGAAPRAGGHRGHDVDERARSTSGRSRPADERPSPRPRLISEHEVLDISG